MELDEEVARYRRALSACVRLQDPSAYRDFVHEWSGLIQRGAADRLVQMDDDALAVRLARMALDDSELTDVHPRARATLKRYGVVADRGLSAASEPVRARTVRLRRLRIPSVRSDSDPE